jgi:hypothetical protein
MDLEPKSPIDKTFIQKRVSPEEVFEHYLGVEVRPGYKFCNPLRVDENPTCKFFYSGDKPYFSDFAVETGMDCFDLVMWHYNCGFQQALRHIAEDMGLRDVDASEKTGGWSPGDVVRKGKGNYGHTSIKVRTADFTRKDASYLKSHGISKQVAEKYWCYGIDHVWVNGEHIWMRTPERPAIGYYFGTDEEDIQHWKIYFYEDDEDRFLCNTGRIQGWPQLPETGDTVLITKSLKDVMALHSFGVNAIAPQGETIKPPTEKIESLKSRFNTVLSLYDFDDAGITMANFLKREYDIDPLFLTNGDYGTTDYGAKDFSDYVRNYGRQATYDLIAYARRHVLEQGIEEKQDVKEDSSILSRSNYLDTKSRRLRDR